MDALFIFICLGVVYLKNRKRNKNTTDMEKRLNPDKHKSTNAFVKLYDFVIGKGGL